MSDAVQTFIDAMVAAGVGPARQSDIKPTGKWEDYALSGDRPRQKVGAYRLTTDGNGTGFGNFGDHRSGIFHKWSSKVPTRFTEEEKRAWKKRMAEDVAKAEDQLKAQHEAVAREAKLTWDALPLATTEHPYLARKKIQPHGVRLKDDMLVVPQYIDGRMAGYQTIDEAGEKFFLKNGEQKGAYYVLASKEDDKSRIVICEGFATGASIREATGFPVVVAFVAGNLQPVAQAFAQKYPDAQFILAADDDKWTWDGKLRKKHLDAAIIPREIPGDDPRWVTWRKAGYLVNTGRTRAEQAAASIGGAHVIWPEFPEKDADRRTDFNDLHLSDGLDAVRARILHIPEPDAPDVPVPVTLSQHITSENFWDFMRIKSVDKNGLPKFDDNSLNYAMVLQYHPRLMGVFAWDEFHVSTIVRSCPPWLIDQGRESEFSVHELGENDVRECDYFLQASHGQFRGSKEKTEDAICDAAHRCRIHPARDYFDGLTWDGIPRLDTWLPDYLGCTKDDPDYVRAVGRTWLMAVVARVKEPGCKFDHMLILEGAQGAGKSTALEILSTFGDGPDARAYFCDTLNLRNCEDPDELMKTRGSLIVEIQEMSGFTKKDDDALKTFITQKTDQYRAPYGRKTEKWPRQFVLAGTYNPIDGIFKDPTGLRRYWVVGVGNRIDLPGLRKAREQLWAEAVHRYNAGETLLLSKELYGKAEKAANNRRIVDDMTHDVLAKVRGVKFFEVREVMEWLGIPNRGRQQTEARNIGRILKVEGFRRVQMRVSGRNVWGWAPPESEVLEMVYEDEEEIIPF